MSPERIDSLLTNFRPNQARLVSLRREADELRRSIANEQRLSIHTDAIHAQQYSGMPHAGTINRAVEETALRYADGYQSPLVRQWVKELEALEREIESLDYAVSYVSGWLEILSEKERVVLLNHSPVGLMSWREMAFASRKLLGEDMSQSGLRKIAEAAKRKIRAIAT